MNGTAHNVRVDAKREGKKANPVSYGGYRFVSMCVLPNRAIPPKATKNNEFS